MHERQPLHIELKLIDVRIETWENILLWFEQKIKIFCLENKFKIVKTPIETFVIDLNKQDQIIKEWEESDDYYVDDNRTMKEKADDFLHNCLLVLQNVTQIDMDLLVKKFKITSMIMIVLGFLATVTSMLVMLFFEMI